MARLTALPMPPEELSTCSMAGASFSRNSTAPSAASTGSFLATVLISTSASLMRWIGVSDFQPNALRRKRGANCHLYAVVMCLNMPLKSSCIRALRIYRINDLLYFQLGGAIATVFGTVGSPISRSAVFAASQVPLDRHNMSPSSAIRCKSLPTWRAASVYHGRS